MNSEELKLRFRKYSVRIIKMVDKLPNTISGRAIGSQIVRSGTSLEQITELHAKPNLTKILSIN